MQKSKNTKKKYNKKSDFEKRNFIKYRKTLLNLFNKIKLLK